MEEKKKKVKSIEISVRINKEKVTMKSFLLRVLKMLLVAITVFNIGLALVVAGAKIVLGYTLVHSFAQWIGYNFLALGIKWIYGILFKERVTLVIPEDTKAQIERGFEETDEDVSKKEAEEENEAKEEKE